MRLRWALAACLIATCLLVFSWWALSGYPTQGQICEPPGSDKNCESYNILFALAWNGASKLDHWSVLLTAIFTGFISWFTILLARTSASQTELTQRIERPYIFIFKPDRPTISIIEYDGYNDDVADKVLVEFNYVVANQGKIPAIIKRVRASMEISYAPHDPSDARSDHPVFVAGVLAANDSYSPEDQIVLEDSSLDEYGDVLPNLGSKKLFFRAVISYRGPFTDDHETSVCWEYDESTRRFTGPAGGQEYNYER